MKLDQYWISCSKFWKNDAGKQILFQVIIHYSWKPLKIAWNIILKEKLKLIIQCNISTQSYIAKWEFCGDLVNNNSNTNNIALYSATKKVTISIVIHVHEVEIFWVIKAWQAMTRNWESIFISLICTCLYKQQKAFHLPFIAITRPAAHVSFKVDVSHGWKRLNASPFIHI